jgi:hypothetical protein
MKLKPRNAKGHDGVEKINARLTVYYEKMTGCSEAPLLN